VNDLWKYQLDDFTWTWLGGNFVNNYLGIFDDNGYPDSNNMPGARTGAVGWYDGSTQEFWLFGGSTKYGTCIYQSIKHFTNLIICQMKETYEI